MTDMNGYQLVLPIMPLHTTGDDLREIVYKKLYELIQNGDTDKANELIDLIRRFNEAEIQEKIFSHIMRGETDKADSLVGVFKRLKEFEDSSNKEMMSLRSTDSQRSREAATEQLSMKLAVGAGTVGIVCTSVLLYTILISGKNLALSLIVCALLGLVCAFINSRTAK